MTRLHFTGKYRAMSVQDTTETLQVKEVGENWLEVIHEARFKVVLLGDSSVGKTSLAMLHQRKEVHDNPKATIGFDCYTKDIKLKSGISAKLQIWDTAGMERFRQSMIPKYYDLISGAVLIYDITNEDSFVNLDTWMKELESYCNPRSLRMALIGNKADNEIHRKVSLHRAKSYAQRYGMHFEELSACELSSYRKLDVLVRGLAEGMYDAMMSDDVNLASQPSKAVIELNNNASAVSCSGHSGSPPPSYNSATSKTLGKNSKCC